jgi:ribonuclease BN (tRNA processing enzyme)
MKVTVLGVSSAFATGTYEDAISVKEACAMAKKITNAPEFKDASEDVIEAAIKKFSKRYYLPRWQSNFLIEFDMPDKRGKGGPYRLLLDAGADVRHALKGVGLTSADIDGIYISHPHSDHIGGMEFLALTTLFNPFYTPKKKEWLGDQFIADKLFLEQEAWPTPPANSKPDIFIHRKVLEPLRRALGPGLDTVQGVPDVRLETYFDIHIIGKQQSGETKKHVFHDGEDSWRMTPLFAMHVISSSEEMASYGISLEHSNGYNVLFPTDTQHMMPPQLVSHYRRANRIYMDCETSAFPSGVHPHLSDLVDRMEPEIQKKCLLYHYDGYPEVPEGTFADILKPGDSHTYPE